MAQVREEQEAGKEAAAAGPGLPEMVRRRREEKARRGGQGVRRPQGREGHEALARRPTQDGGGRRERQNGEAVREGCGQDRVRLLEGPQPRARREPGGRLRRGTCADQRTYLRSLVWRQARGPRSERLRQDRAPAYRAR